MKIGDSRRRFAPPTAVDKNKEAPSAPLPNDERGFAAAAARNKAATDALTMPAAAAKGRRSKESGY